MPRPKFKREPCDCLDCREPGNLPDLGKESAAARQDPPPKCLIVFAEGFLGHSPSLGKEPIPHLNAFARDGCSGILALRKEIEGDQPGIANVVAQLLDVPQDLCEASESGVSVEWPSISSRFKGLNVAVATQSKTAQAVAVHAGCSLAADILLAQQSQAGTSESPAFPDPDAFASIAMRTLGLTAASAELDATSASQVAAEDLDILLVHLSPPQLFTPQEAPEAASQDYSPLSGAEALSDPDPAEGASSSGGLEWLDEVCSALNRIPGTRESLLVVLLLSSSSPGLIRLPPAGGIRIGDLPEKFLAKDLSGGMSQSASQGSRVRDDSLLDIIRPVQSFQLSNCAEMDVSGEALLVVQRLPGVIRRDNLTRLEVKDSRMGGGCILAQRMIHEIAYKLGRAPKYGA